MQCPEFNVTEICGFTDDERMTTGECGKSRVTYLTYWSSSKNHACAKAMIHCSSSLFEFAYIQGQFTDMYTGKKYVPSTNETEIRLRRTKFFEMYPRSVFAAFECNENGQWQFTSPIRKLFEEKPIKTLPNVSCFYSNNLMANFDENCNIF